MVTTGQDAVAFITGTHRIDCKALTSDEWMGVLGYAFRYVNVEFLRGLQSISQILRRRTEKNEALWQFGVSQLEKSGISPHACDMLILTELQSLPSWEEWPRRSDGKKYKNVREKVLLYVRTKHPTSYETRCKVLTAEWSLEVDEDTEGRVKARRVQLSSIELTRITRLEDLFDSFSSKKRMAEVGARILIALHIAQRETADFTVRRANLAQGYERELWGLIQRAGIF